ncbi:MAG: bifunctional glutamate N-acetyltransferase/amino-acid acetyltransferase ArgJ [Mycobacteriales bacterium]
MTDPVVELAIDQSRGVTAPAGFRSAGVAAGIKASGDLDLALVVNDGPLDSAAGVFTSNKIQAAPVLWSRQAIADASLRAVVLNSGGANACTGVEGFADTRATARHVAALLGCEPTDVAVCSTGLIGERLPMPAVLSGIDTAASALAATPQAGLAAATAVLTTDTHAKQAWVSSPAGWSIGGFVKGAGMLAPNLATMLCVLTTDAVLTGDVLDTALRAATGVTFDRLDVDGGISTNDTVLVLTSGASGIAPDHTEFTELLTAISADLVAQLRSDAEGATKEIDIVVRGAVSEADAVAVGRVVAEDNLVKTALFGSDPNWGRIAMALGRAPAEIDPDRLSITICGVPVMAHGTRARDRSTADLSGRSIEVVIDLGLGQSQATILTTDLSHAYVEENSAYSS